MRTGRPSRGRAGEYGEAACAQAAETAAAMVGAARATALRVSLARTVRHASPLLLDALAARGVALGEVLDRLEPAPAGWPADTVPRRLSPVQRHYRRRASGYVPWMAGEPSAPLTAAPGEGLRLVWARSRLGLRGPAGRLGVATAGSTAWLGIADGLPQTLALALVGRHVDALVSHPLLDGRDYIVLRVEADVRGLGGTLIQVRTGLRRCRTPWTPREAVDAGSAVMRDLVGAVS